VYRRRYSIAHAIAEAEGSIGFLSTKIPPRLRSPPAAI
jgi:hypothetical protein